MKIALLGFGVVGSGAYEIIASQPECGITVKRALVQTMRPGPVDGLLTTDMADILDDPEIELVAEAMGGLEPAYRYVLAALRAGKHVVTANKLLVCQRFRELNQAAAESGVQFRYTASAGGGIPWLFNLLRAKRLDEIQEISGCINGTSNFILGNMHKYRASFERVLSEAQRMGYAEADPSADIDGLDLQRKCAISASLAFSMVVEEQDVLTAGIRHITKEDIEWAEAHGMICKQMMHCKKVLDGISAYVEPTFLPNTLPEANLPVRSSIASLYGKYVGRLTFFGAGAGTLPTGMNMMQDVMDVMAGVGKLHVYTQPARIFNQEESHPYYVRCPGPLPKVQEQGDGWAVIGPMPVEEMHQLAKEKEGAGIPVFFAGLAQEA